MPANDRRLETCFDAARPQRAPAACGFKEREDSGDQQGYAEPQHVVAQEPRPEEACQRNSGADGTSGAVDVLCEER